jgi:hypothetical protein
MVKTSYRNFYIPYIPYLFLMLSYRHYQKTHAFFKPEVVADRKPICNRWIGGQETVGF